MPVAGLGRSKNSSAATPLMDRPKTNADTMMMIMMKSLILMMMLMMMTMMMMLFILMTMIMT